MATRRSFTVRSIALLLLAGPALAGSARATVLSKQHHKQQQQKRAGVPFLRSGAARHLIAGAAAGVVSNTVVAPLDILRLNLICSNTRTNALEVARSIYSQGGLRAFWRGNMADVLRTIPSSAVRFYSFAVYKAGLPALFQSAGVQAANLAVVSLLAGGFAGMTAMALLFPLETVRTQMATQGATDLSVLSFANKLVQKGGVPALYRGMPMSLVSVMPYFAIRFGVYDILKRWHITLADGEFIPKTFNAAYGFTAGFCASAITFPMEVIRRRAMSGVGDPNPLIAVPLLLRTDGLPGLYRGYFVNACKVAPASAITFFTYEVVRSSLDWLAGVQEDEPVKEHVKEP